MIFKATGPAEADGFVLAAVGLEPGSVEFEAQALVNSIMPASAITIPLRFLLISYTLLM
jgi:hypothetical protein